MIDFREVTGVALAGGTKRNPDNMIKFDYSKTYPYSGGILKNGLVRYGITFNVKEDGSIIMNGTSTTEFWLVFGADVSITPGVTYTWSANCPEVARHFISMSAVGYDADGNKLTLGESCGGVDANKTAKKTIPEGYISMDWRIHIWKGVTLNNVVFRPMCNEGETLNDYYLPITAWSDVENVYWTKRSPANIIPLPYALSKSNGTNTLKPENETIDGITATYRPDGSIVFNGTSTRESGNTNFVIGRFPIPRSGIYRVTLKNDNLIAMMVQVVSKSNSWVANIGNTGGMTSANFTIPQEYVDKGYKFNVTVYTYAETIGKQLNNIIKYPILQYMNTQTMPYYANKPNPKNLLLVQNKPADKTSNGLEYVINPDGSIKVKGTLTKAASSIAWRLPELELGKTYTYHLNASNYYDTTLTLARAVKGFIQIYTINENGYPKFVKNVGNQVNSTGFTFTVTEDMLQEGYYFRNNIYIYDANIATSYDFICYPILNEGETAEPFYIE